MAQKKHAGQLPIVPIGVAFVIAGLFIAFLVITVRNGSGPTESQATGNEFLTPGDDALSLQQDLKKLESEPAVAAEAQLDSLQ
jgi:hypothetical protein